MKYADSKTLYAHYTVIHGLRASTFTCICAGLDIDGAILDPWGDNDVISHVAGDLTSQYGCVPTDDILIVHLQSILLLHHCNTHGLQHYFHLPSAQYCQLAISLLCNIVTQQ
jgi:hypothetical protein